MSRFRDLVTGKRDTTPKGSSVYANRQYMDVLSNIPIGISRPENDHNRVAPPPSALRALGTPSLMPSRISGETVIGKRRTEPLEGTDEINWKEIDALPAEQQILRLRQMAIEYQDQLFRLRKQVSEQEHRISDLRLQRDQQTETVNQSRTYLLNLVRTCPQSANLHLSGRGFPEEWTLDQMYAFLMESVTELASQAESAARSLEAERAHWQQKFTDLQEVVYRLQTEATGDAARAELEAVSAQVNAERTAIADAPLPDLVLPEGDAAGASLAAEAAPGTLPAVDARTAPPAAAPPPGARTTAAPWGAPAERDEQGRVREMVIVDLKEYERLFAEDERARVVLHAIGSTGLSRASDLADLPAIQTAFTTSNAQFNRSELHKSLSKIDSMGFLTATELKTGGKGRPPIIYQLNDRGRAMYRSLFGEDPVLSEAERLRKTHSSLEHGFFIKDVARALRDRGFEVFEERADCTFDVRVDGEDRRVVYDLVARRTVDGGKVEQIFVECEMGTQTDELFLDKCEKIYHHNPEAMYFVCPSDSVMTQKTAVQFDRWVRTRGRKTIRGLTAHFATLDMLRRKGKSGSADDFWGCWNKKSF